MKKIKTYNIFINESLKDKMKGKSDKDILDKSKNLSPFQKFEYGCQYGILPLVKDVIDNKSVSKYNFEYGFGVACAFGHLDIIKYLLDKTDINPGVAGSASIKNAASENKLNVVKFLLKDDRVDPSAENNYALRVAIDNNYNEISKELLKDDRVIQKLNNNSSLTKYKYKVEKLKLNESLKNKMKGKSLDSIEDILNNSTLSPIGKMEKAAKYQIIPLIKKLLKDKSLKVQVNSLYRWRDKERTIKELINYEDILNKLKDDINNQKEFNEFINNFEYKPSFYRNVRNDNGDFENKLVNYDFTNISRKIIKDIVNKIKYNNNLKILERHQNIFNFWFNLLHNNKLDTNKYYLTDDNFGPSINYYVNDYFAYINTPHYDYIIFSDKIIDYIKKNKL